MVEVCEDNVDSLVFLAEEVLDGHEDVVEGYVGCTGCGRVGCFDGFGFYAFAAFDDEDGETFVGLYAGYEVIAPCTVCYPSVPVSNHSETTERKGVGTHTSWFH